jgi:hypothetical protein
VLIRTEEGFGFFLTTGIADEDPADG